MIEALPTVALLIIFLIAAVATSWYAGIQHAFDKYHVDNIEQYLESNLPDRWRAYKHGVQDGYDQGHRDGSSDCP